MGVLWAKGALAVACALLAAGCNETKPDVAFAASQSPLARAPMFAAGAQECAPSATQRRFGLAGLAGRTLRVERLADIALGPKEVVLTFDDGPIPGKTARILDTLDRFGVRATFMVVGQMADAYPNLVREVAARGHTIGTHTYGHPNLAKMSRSAALAEIAKGERAVARALSGSGRSAAPFFRFPYLADSAALRRAMADRGTVVIDVDVDSKDYFRTTPAKVLGRTMARLRARGRGIVLFHDIHARTVSALPLVLTALQQEGYRVVHLTPKSATRCPRPGS